MLNFDTDFFAKVVMPFLTFLVGLGLSRFTFTKKEKFDVENQRVKYAAELIAEQDKSFNEFCKTLQKYSLESGTPSLDDFYSISVTGEAYFTRLKISCDAILAGKVDENSAMNTIKPMASNALEKSIPAFYQALQEIARKHKLPYGGSFKESQYMSIVKVVRNPS